MISIYRWQSLNPAPDKSITQILVLDRRNPKTGISTLQNIGACTDTITYLWIYKLYGLHRIITRDSKDPKMSVKFVWTWGNNQHLTVSNKLEMTALKMSKAHMHITFNSEGIARPDKKHSSSSTCLSVSCLTKLKNYPTIPHHYSLYSLQNPPRPSATN
jgi:hypothetical protein